MNSKELVRCLFQKKELPQVLFIPLVWSFAAKVRQATVKEMAANPTLMASALSDAQKLFGYDAIITVFDPSLEAEALGCGVDWISEFQPPLVASHPLEEGKGVADLNADFLNKGRIPTVLEAAKRLNLVRGKEVAVIGLVTGPATLSLHLQGDSFWPQFEKGAAEAKKTMDFTRKCCQDLIKSYCDIGIETIMVVEGMPSRTEEPVCRQMKAAYQAMWNVLRYFKGSSVLLAYGCTADNLEFLYSLGADAVVVGGSVTLSGPIASKVEVGLGFTKTLKPVAPEVPSGGTSMGRPRSWGEVSVLLKDTIGCTVNGEVIPFRAGDPMGTPPALFSGFKKVNELGWDKYGYVTITQTQPLPITVLAITGTLVVGE